MKQSAYSEKTKQKQKNKQKKTITNQTKTTTNSSRLRGKSTKTFPGTIWKLQSALYSQISPFENLLLELRPLRGFE